MVAGAGAAASWWAVGMMLRVSILGLKGLGLKRFRVTVKGGSTEQLQTLANLGLPPMLTP